MAASRSGQARQANRLDSSSPIDANALGTDVLFKERPPLDKPTINSQNIFKNFAFNLLSPAFLSKTFNPWGDKFLTEGFLYC